MSRRIRYRMRSRGCFPRVSGDEPGVITLQGVEFEFSPRERG